MVAFVAEPVIVARPASSYNGSAASDSPENPGNRHDSNAEQIAYETVGFKRDTLAKVRERFEKEGKAYYDHLIEADGRKVISPAQLATIYNLVESLKNHPFSSKFILGNDQYKIFTQQALTFNYLGFECKALLDLVVVDLDNKFLYPIDLKT